MPEDLTVVPMDAADREQLMVLLRNPDDADMTWLHGFIRRYDIARSFARAGVERPERIENLCDQDWEYAGSFRCNPDESAGAAEDYQRGVRAREAYDRDGYGLDDPKHPGWHSVHADLWDSRAGK